MNIGYWLHLGYGYYFGYKVDGYSYWLITKPKVYGYNIWLNLLVRLLVVPITLSVRVINNVSYI